MPAEQFRRMHARLRLGGRPARSRRGGASGVGAAEARSEEAGVSELLDVLRGADRGLCESRVSAEAGACC